MDTEVEQGFSVRVPYDENKVTITHPDGRRLELTKDEGFMLSHQLLRQIKRYPGGMLLDIEKA